MRRLFGKKASGLENDDSYGSTDLVRQDSRGSLSFPRSNSDLSSDRSKKASDRRNSTLGIRLAQAGPMRGGALKKLNDASQIQPSGDNSTQLTKFNVLGRPWPAPLADVASDPGSSSDGEQTTGSSPLDRQQSIFRHQDLPTRESESSYRPGMVTHRWAGPRRSVGSPTSLDSGDSSQFGTGGEDEDTVSLGRWLEPCPCEMCTSVKPEIPFNPFVYVDYLLGYMLIVFVVGRLGTRPEWFPVLLSSSFILLFGFCFEIVNEIPPLQENTLHALGYIVLTGVASLPTFVWMDIDSPLISYADLVLPIFASFYGLYLFGFSIVILKSKLAPVPRWNVIFSGFGVLAFCGSIMTPNPLLLYSFTGIQGLFSVLNLYFLFEYISGRRAADVDILYLFVPFNLLFCAYESCAGHHTFMENGKLSAFDIGWICIAALAFATDLVIIILIIMNRRRVLSTKMPYNLESTLFGIAAFLNGFLVLYGSQNWTAALLAHKIIYDIFTLVSIVLFLDIVNYSIERSFMTIGITLLYFFRNDKLARRLEAKLAKDRELARGSLSSPSRGRRSFISGGPKNNRKSQQNNAGATPSEGTSPGSPGSPGSPSSPGSLSSPASFVGRPAASSPPRCTSP